VKHDELTQLLSPVIASLGLECLGVEYSPYSGASLLRIYIDAPDRAVDIDDCERVSREVAAVLDVEDPIKGRYTLEVSSPGLDRPLFTPAQFARFAGQSAKLSLNVPLDGRRRFQGPIKAVDGERITIEQDGVDVVIEHGNVLKANLVPEFEPKGEKKGGDKPRKGKAGKAKRKH
jgi:ribosome maturation factor RimP